MALEALAGELSLAELAAKHDVHPNVIQQWRRHAKIGELTIEKDFLAKAFGR